MSKSSNKIKRIEKNNMCFLEMKSAKGQQLDATQVEMITKGNVDGLLPLAVKESHGNSFTLMYNATGMSSLKEYLESIAMNKVYFGFLLQNIFDVYKTITSNYFQPNCLLLSLGRVKVEPSSKRLYFMYVPIQNFDNETSLKEFLLSILDGCTFEEGQDLSYVQEYIRILNTGVNFSIFDLEQYISSLTSTNNTQQATKTCPNCGHKVPKDANYCTNCCYSYIHKSVTGPLNSGTAIYDPLSDTNYVPDTDSNDVDWGNSWDDEIVSLDNVNPEFENSTNDVVLNDLGVVITPEKTEEEVVIPEKELDNYEVYNVIQNTETETTGNQPNTNTTTPDEQKEEQDKEKSGFTEDIGTSVLGVDEDKEDELVTTVLTQEKRIVKNGILTRVSTNERKNINLSQFSLGRSQTNDFVISGNTAVGRQHAVIIKEEDRFFIIDLNSTNKSYINGKIIPPRQKVELFNDTKIMLANEELMFNIVVTEE